MPRVKCPHCGAGNQDATEQDTCWQCATVLGAPVVKTASPEPQNAPQVSAPTQQLSPQLLNNLPQTSQKLARQNNPQRNMTLALIVALVIAIVVILVLILKR